jgi:hypothetical protein
MLATIACAYCWSVVGGPPSAELAVPEDDEHAVVDATTITPAIDLDRAFIALVSFGSSGRLRGCRERR